jgi:hypothetical protein
VPRQLVDVRREGALGEVVVHAVEGGLPHAIALVRGSMDGSDGQRCQRYGGRNEVSVGLCPWRWFWPEVDEDGVTSCGIGVVCLTGRVVTHYTWGPTKHDVKRERMGGDR